MNYSLFRYIGLSLLLFVILILVATNVSAQESVETHHLTTSDVLNIFLPADGMGGGIQMVEGAAQEYNGTEVVYNYQIIYPIALGDLDDDEAGDAAMVLAVAPTDGAQTSYSVNAILNMDGEAVLVAFAVPENVSRVLNLAIRDGLIVVDLITRGADDPECCAATPVRQIYKLQSSGSFDLIEDVSFEDAELPFTFDNELTRDELANLTYPETFDYSTIDLVDGEYSYTLDEHTFSYQLLDNIVNGDLTGDGLDDAVVLLQYSFDGEPAIQHMYVVINDRGMPLISGWRDYSRTGDVEIENITIDDQVLTVELVDTVHDNHFTETLVIDSEILVTVE
jgi:hypothetical protein